jgi:hypothetical protein
VAMHLAYLGAGYYVSLLPPPPTPPLPPTPHHQYTLPQKTPTNTQAVLGESTPGSS